MEAILASEEFSFTKADSMAPSKSVGVPVTVSKGRSNAGNTHIAGELFVAAELAKRGYLVSLTMGYAKAIDIFAELNGRAICIQVKAIAHNRNVGWPLPFEKRKIPNGVMYVCVVLNEEGKSPTYYILPPKEVRERGHWFRTRAILNVGEARRGNFEDNWDLIKQAIRAPGLIA